MRQPARAARGHLRLALSVIAIVCGLNGGPLAADESTTQRVAMLASRSADTDPAIHSRVLDTYGKMPLSFELNQGQSDPRVKFLSRGARYEVFLNPTEALLGLREPEKYQDPKSALAKIPQKPALPEFATLAMRLNGANPAAQVEGQGALELKSNYLIGNDRSKWHTGIANYRSVRFSSIYSGIDLVYHGSDQGRLEYDFVVAPGADPSKIEISFEGAKGLKLKNNGDLGIKIAGGEVVEHAPVIYQHKGDKRETVSGRYVLRSKNRFSFELAAYDRGREVIIDPVIVYSTFLGGSGQDNGFGVAADSAGVAYVTGKTCSMNFPVTPGSFQGSKKGTCAAFATKLDTVNSTAVYSTYTGGSGGDDEARAIAVDNTGTAFITGGTSSTDFPTTASAFQKTLAGGEDAFVLRLNRTGDSLLYSTYIGGNGEDEGSAIAIDSSGNAYITGYVCSSNFPLMNPLQPKLLGNCDANVTKLSSTGQSLIYSTYLGGTDFDVGHAIAVDNQGSAYVTGYTLSKDYPTFPKTGSDAAYQQMYRGGGDAFVTKLTPAGTALSYSTFLGGSGFDVGNGIAVDSAGNAYVSGSTFSADFVTGDVPGTFKTMSGGQDAFVAKVDNGGDALLYFTYLGGSSSDQSFGLALDSSNNAWVTGLTCSTNFPTTPGAFEPSAPGLCDGYISKVDQSGNVMSSSYLGGKFFDQGNGVAVDSSCNSYVTGFTCSADLPHTSGAFQSANGGPSGNNIGVCGDSFLTRVASVTLNGRGAAIAVSGLGIVGDTGNVTTTRNGTKMASLAVVNTSIVQATLLQSTVTSDECAGLSTADSRVASTTLSFSGAPVITAKTVDANSQTTCQGSTGTTNIGSIQIGNGTPSSGGFAPNTMMQLGNGNYLVLNEQMPSSTPDKSLTVSAMHLHAGGYDTLVGYAKSDVGSCPTSCAAGLTDCGISGTPGFCRNLSSDPNNCGSCGHICAGSCAAGVCH